MTSPLVTLGGTADKPLLHLAPANGFVLETYLPLLRPFLADFQAVSLPPRALWQPTPPQQIETWREEAAFLQEQAQSKRLPPMIGMGHSYGALITLMASSLFKAMILLDPTILPRQVVEYMALLRREGRALENPLSQGALRRRRTFASVDETYTNFRSKSVFAQWPDEVVRLYAEYGTRPTETGERTLTWSPEWEAYSFSGVPEDLWSRVVPGLPQITIPTLILRGGTSDTYTEETAREIAQLWPQATHAVIADHGHLFPQSAPEATAQHIRAWLQTQNLL